MTTDSLPSTGWTRHVELPSGTLYLHVEWEDMPLDVLCGFACRRSHKRGFVFVSKVLGKHYPVRPALMDAVHARLAARLTRVSGPAVVVAMAETATALGQGVFEHLVRTEARDDLLFLHTTRYRLHRPLALSFEESHSHATAHFLYEPPLAADAQLFRSARTLVLVDDELSTGRTLAGLTKAYRRLNPGLSSVRIVTLTDWTGHAGAHALSSEVGVPVEIQSLLRGCFGFVPTDGFDPGPVPDVVGRGDAKDGYLSCNSGRLGTRGLLDLDLAPVLLRLSLREGERILVLGTGEFGFKPFRLARHLSELGFDVHYQSTTRSPLLVGPDLASVVEFIDNYHDQMPNYLYNVAGRQYDRIVIGYETRPLPPAHCLPELLGAEPVFL